MIRIYLLLFILLFSATHVEYEDGSTVILSRDNLSQRQGIAKRLLTPTAGMKSKWGTKKVST